MKYSFCILVLLLLNLSLFAQTAAPSPKIVNKPVIDSAAIVNWADLLWSEPSISPDGKYFMYPIDNFPVGSKTLVIQSTENSWKKEFIGADKGFFSGDSKLTVFKTNDTIFIQLLGKDKILAIPDVVSYKNSKENNGHRLAYLTKAGELTLYNLITRKVQRYQNIADYQFSDDGRVLLIKTKNNSNGATGESVQWLNLSNDKSYTVWQTANNTQSSAKSFKFDNEGKQIVFTVQNRNKKDPENAIWYYKEGMDSAIEKVTNETSGIDSGMIVSPSGPSFNKNGNYIFFKLQKRPEPQLKPSPDAVQVDVWSYKDPINQNIQLYLLKNPSAYPVLPKLSNELTAFTSVKNNCITNLGSPGMQVYIYAISGDFLILSQRNYIGDKLWLHNKMPLNYYLVSLLDGRHNLFNSGHCDNFIFSPDGKYLVFFDQNKQQYFSFNVLTNQLINISFKIPYSLVSSKDKETKLKNLAAFGIKGFISGDAIVYDEYDIWRIDISGKKDPVNLTNGYGRIHQTTLRLFDRRHSGWRYFREVIQLNEYDTLLLTSFDTRTKYNGFFKIHPAKVKNPEKLILSSQLYYVEEGIGSEPVKAAIANVWIVKGRSVSEAPNFFITRNFRSFEQLTNVQPQRKYNWFKSELLVWHQRDGQTNQGILYKPDNFDPEKKYPVIVNYYDKKSDGLHQFLKPAIMGNAEINIPWFVSKGYLVFTPDIYFTVGKTSESIVNSVESGVKALFKYPFVDSTKVGITGHSFGGYETNVLVTHLNIFAAAAEGAGATDLISAYGSILPDGSLGGGAYPFMHIEENIVYRLETLLWDNPQAYIDNSPIFIADKVTTPLLMLHNKLDGLVPWGQAVEFFIALRRLNKKVWMLQYDEESHGVNSVKGKMDYTIRMTQFFDHYLKGIPAPKWMKKGIPAIFKSIDTGYQLSNSNEIP